MENTYAVHGSIRAQIKIDFPFCLCILTYYFFPLQKYTILFTFRLIHINRFIQTMLNLRELSEIKHDKTILQPSLDGGYRAIYHNKVPMDIKYVDYDRNVKHIGGSQLLTIKIFSYGNKSNIAKIKLEVGSDFDPFLNLVFECDEQKYGYLKNQQTISAQFQQFPTILIKCFNKVEQQTSLRVNDSKKGKMALNLLMGSDGKAKLVINQGSEYKNVQVLSIDLLSQNEQQTEQKVSYKYEQLRKKVMKTEQRLRQIQQIIKSKNPTLLTQIFKTTQAQNGKLNISAI